MNEELANDSWRHALAFYDTLQGPQWGHIPGFRRLVSAIGRSVEARGLTAVTSHEILLVSPYTKYPDWFDGRHVRLVPLADGQVRVERYPAGSQLGAAETWTATIEDVQAGALRAIGEL